MSNEKVTYPDAGCIVEFMQGNVPQIAWMLENQNGKARLLLPNRRETTMQTARLLPWHGPCYPSLPSRDAAVETLENHAARRAELEKSLNPIEWWELAQGEISRVSASWCASMVGDANDSDLAAACGHVLLAAKTHFKFQPPDFEILDAETVERRMAEHAREAARERLDKQGAAFARALWDVFLKKSPPPPPDALKSLDEDVLAAMRELLPRIIATPEAQSDPLWRAVSKGLPDDPNLALHLAQAWGLVGPHHNIWLDRAGYDTGNGWTIPLAGEIHAVMAAAQSAELVRSDVPFISIDNATTRDIDDAFAIETLPEGGWRLTLALACPALCWPFDGSLDMAVRGRSTSLYLPEGTSHMLPEEIGAGAFSLFTGEERPALTVTCEISAGGDIVSCEPAPARVCLRANLNYADCEVALDGADNAAAPYLAQLRAALAMAEVRQACRVRNGAVIIERPELDIRLLGELTDRSLRVSLEQESPIPRAHLLVAEEMIIANAGLARWAHARGMALLFRTQDVKTEEGLAGIWTDPVDIAAAVRQLTPACMDTEPRPHVGVGETMYAPVTSPLRRYPDLVNEAQILHMLATGAPRWDKDALDRMLVYVNARMDAAGMVQRLRTRYWKLLYIRQQGDVLWPAVITDANDTFATVTLPREQLIVRGRRSAFPENIRTGMPVSVRFGKINPLLGDIMLMEAREREAV